MEIRLCYLGKHKSGKTSIINYLFNNTKKEETTLIPPTKGKYTLSYQSSFLQIINLEFSGEYENFDNLTQEEEDLIKIQDVFIYVYDLKSKSTESSLKLLKNQVKTINRLNKKAQIYTFFHQSDLDYIYQGAKVEDTIEIFSSKFDYFIKNFFSDSSMMKRYSKRRTTLYDFSINEAMSNVISDQISNKMKTFSKMFTEVTKASKMGSITLFDLNSKLYIAKDNIPLDPNTIFLFIDSLKLLSQFQEFNSTYKVKYQDIDEQKNNPKSNNFFFETTVVLSTGDLVYIKQFDEKLCFVIFYSDFCIENKEFLDFNLEVLKQYILETVKIMI